VEPAEFAFGVVLVLLLVGLAGYFAWRQRATLRELREHPEMPAEDRRFLRNQVIRRLLCSALMVVLAGMLVGWYFMAPTFSELFQQGREAWAAAEEQVFTERQEDFRRRMVAYWCVALLVLFAIIAVAGADAWAIGRYGLRHRRQLRDERQQTLLELEAARRRHQGNGQG
jgi:uncharacterized BrkB/YihY/UPF0761 family membrane protein